MADAFLFQDKTSYLDVLFEIAGIALRVPDVACIAFVEDDFWTKIGIMISVPNVQFVLCGEGADLDAVEFPTDRACLGIYAIQHSSIGMRVCQALVARGIKYRVAGGYKVGGYVYDDRVARRSVEQSHIDQRLAGFAKFEDPGAAQDFINLCQALYNTRHLPGDVVEVGCFRGSSGCVMLGYARAKGLPPRRFHFMDVFTGFDYPEALSSSDSSWANTHGTEGKEIVEARLQSMAGDNEVHVHQANVISDPLPDIAQISVCNIDVDLYEAVLAGLFRFAPLIVPGGIMICEDAGHTPSLIGARIALEEFLEAEAGRAFTPIHMTSGQVFLVKHGA